MRQSLLRCAALSALGLAAGLCPAAVKAGAPDDGQDLPCNAFCRDWMGPAYTGSDTSTIGGSGSNAAVAPAGAMGETDREPDYVQDEPSRPAMRHKAHRDQVYRPRERAPAMVSSDPRAGHHPRLVDRDREPSPREQPRSVAEAHDPQARPAVGSPARVAGPAADKTPVASIAPVNGAVKPAVQTPPASSDDSLAVKLDKDAHTVTVSLPDRPSEHIQLTAGQVDNLIQKIGTTRSEMQPQPQPNWSYGQSVVSIYDPRWTTEAERRKGDTLLHIRDPRFGWLHYTIPRMTAQQLSGLLAKQAAIAAPMGRRAEVSR